MTQWQWGARAHEACCMRPKHTTRPRVGVGGVGVCCGPEPTWGCSRNVYYFCVVAAIPSPSKSGLAEGGFYFYFCKKMPATPEKRNTAVGVFFVFKHGDASVYLGPDAAWCRLNLESSTRGHGRFHFFRRRGRRGRRRGRGRRLPLFILFYFILFYFGRLLPARPHASREPCAPAGRDHRCGQQ